MRIIKIVILIFVLISPIIRIASAQSNPTNYLKEFQEQLELNWPENRTINIVFHGHSVPSGYFKTPVVNTLAAYPQLFLKYLKEKYPHVVINSIVTAIGGENSEQGSKRFQSDVLVMKPDLLFIDYALNERRIGLERTELAWRSMIEKALAAKVKIVLLTPTPDLNEDILDENTLLIKYVEMIKKMGAEYKIPAVDVYSHFKFLKSSGANISDYMSQKNHPNEFGHQEVLKVIVSTLFN